MSRRAVWVLCVAMVGTLVVRGHAYVLEGQRWSPGASILVQLQLGPSPTAFLDGNDNWDTVVENALAIWTPFLNNVSFSVLRDSTADTGLRNGKNNVVWGDDVDGEPFGAETLAVTRYLYRVSDNTVTEADIVFNRGKSWNSYRGNLRRSQSGGTLNDLRRVAVHEFGHVLGLGHPDDAGQSVSALMNSKISNIDTVQQDDSDGLSAIYGAVVTRTPDTLSPGGRLLPGQSLFSSDSGYRLVYQADGNLVLYDAEGSATWWTGTDGNAGQAVMQTDGNLVVYDSAGAAQWASGTSGNAGARLVLLNNGDVAIYRSDGQAVWDRISGISPSLPASPPPPQLPPSTTTGPSSANGTWTGYAESTSCRDEGAIAGFCSMYPRISAKLTMHLTQGPTGSITGLVDLGGVPANVSGSLQGDRLQINGTGTWDGAEFEFRAWNTVVSGGTMTGGFTFLEYLKSGGSASYSMSLVDVVRTSPTASTTSR